MPTLTQITSALFTFWLRDNPRFRLGENFVRSDSSIARRSKTENRCRIFRVRSARQGQELAYFDALCKLPTTARRSMAAIPIDMVTVTAMVGFAKTISVISVGLNAETILLSIIT